MGLETGDGKRQHRATCAAELHSLLEFRRNRYDKDVQKKPALLLQGTLTEDMSGELIVFRIRTSLCYLLYVFAVWKQVGVIAICE